MIYNFILHIFDCLSTMLEVFAYNANIFAERVAQVYG